MLATLTPAGRLVLFASLLALICVCPPCRASAVTEPISPKKLLDGGLTLRAQMRFTLQKVEVAGYDVTRLFHGRNDEEPSWSTGKYFVETNIRVLVKGQEELDELQAAIDARQATGLKITLSDERYYIWRWVPGSGSEELHRQEFYVRIETKCEEITNIFYKEIISRVREQAHNAEGGTNKPVNINEVFDALVKDKIDDYMKSLGPVRRDTQCQTTYELLRWLKGGEASGFGLGKYEITEDLKGLLETTINAVRAANADWSHLKLSVGVVGSTDPSEVKKKIPFSIYEPGIEWGNIKKPPDVRYKGCYRNDLVGKDPAYIGFGAEDGKSIAGQITNNCELGAARAYVATVYFVSKFGLNDVDYSYATRGVYSRPPGNNEKFNPKKRKIDIELLVKAAKVNH